VEPLDVDEDRTRFFQCRLDDAVAQLEIGAAIQHPVDNSMDAVPTAELKAAS
jgi:hypothetical protein